MSQLNTALALTRQSQSELNSERAKTHLKDALSICNEIEATEPEGTILKAKILGHLAVEERLPNGRASLWRKSIQTIKTASQPKSAVASAASEEFAALAIDTFQDRYSSVTSEERERVLRQSLECVDSLIKLKDGRFAHFLAAKAALLRHLALLEISKTVRLNRLQEAARCIDLAVKHARSPMILLEQGHCQWALSRHAETDERTVLQLRAAEAAFCSTEVQSTEAGKLTLSRFYRLTFRPMDACRQFPIDRGSIQAVRHVLRDSYLYAEAATQLWFNDYPEETYLPHLNEAKRFLETARDSGYSNARILIDLAFVTAITDGPSAGTTVLSELFNGRQLNIDKLVELASDVETKDPIKEGLALGLDQSAIWTKLGTFMRRFLGDEDRAETFYRTAARLGSRDAVALTNLARHLVRKGDPSALTEAERLLQRAQNFADRRFFWWRHVLRLLLEKRGSPANPQLKALATKDRASKFGQLCAEFQRLEEMKNAQQRGLELEQIIFELSKITFGLAEPAYTVARDGGVIRQIDGFFSAPPDRYRIECKWLSEPASQNELIIFANKLDVAGISGLFVSMSGFKETAVEYAKEIRGQHAVLLLDGEEMRAVFGGIILFDELLSRKRQHFDQLSNPYYRAVAKGSL